MQAVTKQDVTAPVRVQNLPGEEMLELVVLLTG